MIGGGLSGLLLWEINQRQREAAAAQDDPYDGGPVTVFYNDQWYQRRDDLDYYLFMGLDKTTDTLSNPEFQFNNQQADFLLLMVVDHYNEIFYGVHINRDTMAEINKLDATGARIETYTAQICLAHTYGTGKKDSCRNQVWSVSRYFYDLPIKHYIAMTMDGIPVLNDAVGGVVVHIKDDFSNVDESLVMGQDVRLKGNQALTFVRSRQGMADKTNLNRMERQREFMNALYQQVSEKVATEDGFALRLANSLSDYVLSDLTTDRMADLSDSIKNYRFTTIYTIEGEAVVNSDNVMEFYTDEDSFLALMIKLFFEPMES